MMPSPLVRSAGPAAMAAGADIQARLERALAAIDDTTTLSPQRAAEILRTRALALAQTDAGGIAGYAAEADRRPVAETVELLTFDIAGAAYAIETRHVREVVRAEAWTRLPHTPSHVVGIIVLRGELLPVFDLAPLLGRGDAGHRSGWKRLVVLGGAGNALAVPAEQAHSLTRIAAATLYPVESGPMEGGRLVRAFTADGVAVIDGPALLADPRLMIDDDRHDGTVPVHRSATAGD